MVYDMQCSLDIWIYALKPINKALAFTASIREETEDSTDIKSMPTKLSNYIISKTKNNYLFIPTLIKS